MGADLREHNKEVEKSDRPGRQATEGFINGLRPYDVTNVHEHFLQLDAVLSGQQWCTPPADLLKTWVNCTLELLHQGQGSMHRRRIMTSMREMQEVICIFPQGATHIYRRH